MQGQGNDILTELEQSWCDRLTSLERAASAAGFQMGWTTVHAGLLVTFGLLAIADAIARCGDYLRDIARRTTR